MMEEREIKRGLTKRSEGLVEREKDLSLFIMREGK